ncbi:MAG TPA: hypothetical protein VEF04_17730, partial [Blastocatellia bacterium]|nr:hypothetical protein [Blastocatellia bacterium]
MFDFSKAFSERCEEIQAVTCLSIRWRVLSIWRECPNRVMIVFGLKGLQLQYKMPRLKRQGEKLG